VKRLLSAIWIILSSRATSPVVIGFFLLLYIGIAFATDDALTALMETTNKSMVLTFVLALLPLNFAIRIAVETDRYLKRRRAFAGRLAEIPSGLFDETVTLPLVSPLLEQSPRPGAHFPDAEGTVMALPSFAEVEDRLGAMGYRTSGTERRLAASRGISLFPARILFLAGTFCLFAGILVSLTTRTTRRLYVVEGEPLPQGIGGGGLVERINLGASPGPILARVLTMEVQLADSGEGRRSFGLYPPALFRGFFVYPRYLGIAPLVRFSAPDLPGGFETHGILHIYPPGREDRLEITGSPYSVVAGMADPGDGSDPYVSGRINFLFKLVKEKEVVLTGSVPAGGEFVRAGYRLAIPDSRRMVITDFIRDYGVLLVWSASILLLLAWCIWLPVRLLSPRREILYLLDPDMIRAFSRAEGKERRHGGIFHETLDLLEARKPVKQRFDE
jgi:hypothetical protein